MRESCTGVHVDHRAPTASRAPLRLGRQIAPRGWGVAWGPVPRIRSIVDGSLDMSINPLNADLHEFNSQLDRK